MYCIMESSNDYSVAITPGGDIALPMLMSVCTSCLRGNICDSVPKRHRSFCVFGGARQTLTVPEINRLLLLSPRTYQAVVLADEMNSSSDLRSAV